MKFKIKDMDGNDVMGGAVSENNIYIQTYHKRIRGAAPKDLKVGEQCHVKYNLSGSSGEYFIERVE